MPLFPRIQSPCPYKSQLADVMDGDFCRMCERQVFDLTPLSEDERRALLAGCEDEVCVSYRVPLRGAIAAAALAAAAMPTAVAAQDPVPAAVEVEDEIGTDDLSLGVIIVGGIKDPANAEFVALPEDESVPELPTVYEDEEPSQAPADGRETPAA